MNYWLLEITVVLRYNPDAKILAVTVYGASKYSAEPLGKPYCSLCLVVLLDLQSRVSLFILFP